MQHDRKRWSGANKFAVNFDVVVSAWLHTKVRANFTVNCDAACNDQFITMAART